MITNTPSKFPLPNSYSNSSGNNEQTIANERPCVALAEVRLALPGCQLPRLTGAASGAGGDGDVAWLVVAGDVGRTVARGVEGVREGLLDRLVSLMRLFISKMKDACLSAIWMSKYCVGVKWGCGLRVAINTLTAVLIA